MHPCTDAMHGPFCPSTKTQIPPQRNLGPVALHHTAAKVFQSRYFCQLSLCCCQLFVHLGVKTSYMCLKLCYYQLPGVLVQHFEISQNYVLVCIIFFIFASNICENVQKHGKILSSMWIPTTGQNISSLHWY